MVKLKTNPASDIGMFLATLHGEVFDDGGGQIFERGFLMGLSPNPSLSDMKFASSQNVVGPMKTVVTELIENTTYYYRSFAKNEKGYSLAVIKGSDKTTYKYLRNIFIDKIEFREFRYTNFIFQLALPDKDGRMIYREVFVDAKGVERGFAGVCS